MSKSREQLNKYLATVDIDGKVVLDVGVQDKPTSRLAMGVASRYVTLDIDPQWNPDIVADLNKRYSIKKDEVEEVDVIFCIEVLEHCWNPVRVMKNLSSLLKPGGVCYISTPLINPHHDTHDYLRFTDEWYRDTLPKCGFNKVEITERVATTGKYILRQFFLYEGMKISKIRKMDFNSYTYPIGYIIKCTK